MLRTAGEEGEGLLTSMIRPRCPPQRDRLQLQWRSKTIQRSGRGGNDDTMDGSKSNQQSTNDANWRGGGATGRRHDKGRGHAHKNKIDHAEGGLVGANDDHDDDDNSHVVDNDNDDDGGCGGWDGHHLMRKGKGHDDRTKTTIKSITEEGGEDSGDGSDDDDDYDNDDNEEDEATEQPWSW